MFSWIKRIVSAVSFLNTILSIVSMLGFIYFPSTITTSNTLRGFITVFGILGGVLGYFLTASAWMKVSKVKRLRQRNIYLKILWFPLVIFLSTLVVLSPILAQRYFFVRAIREFLLNLMPLPNFIIGLGAAFTLYFLVGAIVLNSKKL